MMTVCGNGEVKQLKLLLVKFVQSEKNVIVIVGLKQKHPTVFYVKFMPIHHSTMRPPPTVFVWLQPGHSTPCTGSER